jgi:hypothetical protein
VDHAAIGGKEVASNIAAVLLDFVADLDDAKVADLLVCRNEVFGEQIANIGV